MLISGVCSVTFRHLGIKEIIELTRQANLATIEWGSDVHVLPGDIKQAAAAGKLCEQAGIGLYSYGSYYTAGEKESNDFTFAAVLASARALGVNTIRVWAGKKDYNVSDRDYFNKVVSDSKRIADLAAAFNISVSFEYHRNTLTSSNTGAYALARALANYNICFYWQPPHGMADTECLQAIQNLKERISNIHCFHWQLNPDNSVQRLPLKAGRERWQKFLAAAAGSGLPHCVLLEFIRDNKTENFYKDAAVLQDMLQLVNKENG